MEVRLAVVYMCNTCLVFVALSELV